jgi:hypothetical protein
MEPLFTTGHEAPNLLDRLFVFCYFIATFNLCLFEGENL